MSGPVMIMAGGTGGHIFPGLAVAQVLRTRNVDVVWLGSRYGMESELVAAAGLPFESIVVQGLRGKSWRTRVAAPIALLRALVQALSVVRRHRPRSVLSMGGFVAGPGGVAAWLLRRPLIVHEQNAVAGLTNRLLSRLALRLLCGFPEAMGRRSEFVGNPVRADIAAIDDPQRRLAERREAPFRLLVVGGSQGAAFLNAVVPEAVTTLPPELSLEVLHQVGRGRCDQVRKRYGEPQSGVDVIEFIDDMAAAYRWADLVICRAGALTVAELAAAGLAAIFVPFPWAVDDHQTRNASAMAQSGGAVVLPESALNADLLREHLRQLLDRETLMTMAGRARQLARPAAAETVTDILLEVAR